MSEDSTLPPPAGPERGVIAGKYRLTRLLGRGGMGAVWEGVHVTLATRVAVKIIEVEHLQSPDSLRRFENEAHAAARLQSKHVVEVYDHGVTEDGRAFIVMQYLQGEPLDRRLERLGRLSPAETARIVVQICRALSKAHALGIVHRDLKPENIYLVWDEEDGADIVKVVDFGIAKFTSPEAAGTHTGYVLGTPFYMSPEQARGLKTLDHRSDLWSVGVIAFRCMVGRLPFQGESVGDVIVELCTGPIPVPSEIVPGLPPGFDAWIERVLTRDLATRFPSAAALSESLASVCGIPIRPHGTGDVPIHSLGDGELAPMSPGPLTPVSPSPVTAASPGPIITPSYPENHPSTSATLLSRLDGATQPIGQYSTGGALTNTPAPAARRGKASTIFAIAMGLIVLGVGVAAIVRVRLSTGATAAGPPLPSAAPPAVAAPMDPFPLALPPPSAAETPSAQNPTLAPPASASAPQIALERPTGKAPRRSTAPPATSSRATPSLDIRLER